MWQGSPGRLQARCVAATIGEDVTGVGAKEKVYVAMSSGTAFPFSFRLDTRYGLGSWAVSEAS